jgi:maleylacetate reductase
MPQVFTYPPMERVHIGALFAEAVAQEADRADASRVFLMVGGTISRETDWPDRLAKALKGRLVASWNRMASHTPRGDVVAATNAARTVRADFVVTLGGGSVTDGGKMVRLGLANEVRQESDLDRLTTHMKDGKRIIPQIVAPSVPMVCVPTTLSAGDFSSGAGCTDEARGHKQSFYHPRMMATAVVLDPSLSHRTPEWLWFSTGIRAVDHAVEDICSPTCNPFSEGAAMQALRLLSRGLRGVKQRPGDESAYLDCLNGAWMSMVGSQSGVEKGASHGIGHALGGAAKVPHGYTSCVMLPTVLRYNLPVNAARQKLVSEAFGEPGTPAADLVERLVRDLGLPGRIRDVGVKPEQLDYIAEMAMHDRWIPTNPRPLPDAAAVRALLDQAW